MAELRPYPFGALIDRMFRELRDHDSIFHLPRRKFVLGDPDHDFTVRFHGHPASTPLGPAAGPQSQMAQNIVLSWLAGCRIFELKTVQIMDELEIPRPCIDMQTIGYNVEWSQELKLGESLDEYVKGAMLVEILVASGELDVPPQFRHLVYDMSVGYDLAGIKTDRVQAFVRGMMDASAVVERLRAEIPDEYARYRDLDFATRLADTLTLSTFHGCPPDEIESIISFLIAELGLHCIVKLNPTLLGPQRVRELVQDTMGYRDLVTPAAAFEKDTKWDQAVAFVERLGGQAAARGVGFGVKFSNTLIVENHRPFFPAKEKEMYVSGAPLHVLAINLVGQFRERFGDRYPISFSAGIDRKNFADAVAIGLTPITVCSDLLKTGGYGRAAPYFKELARRMDEVGATDVDQFILLAYGNAQAALDALRPGVPGATMDERVELDDLDQLDEPASKACEAALASGSLADVPATALRAWVSQAKLLNTKTYVARVTEDPRYALEANKKPPKKVGTSLVLFDCLTCDKCIPVCPNDANFTFVLPAGEVAVTKLRRDGDGWAVSAGEPIRIGKKHQIANFADFCNECGNCDVFCPEDGGPYVLKPRFFGSEADWREFASHDGFFVERRASTDVVLGRFEGQGFRAELRDDGATFEGDGFAIRFDPSDPAATASGEASAEVDLTYFLIMQMVSAAVLADSANYVSAVARA